MRVAALYDALPPATGLLLLPLILMRGAGAIATAARGCIGTGARMFI
jgi:hypothetical protein